MKETIIITNSKNERIKEERKKNPFAKIKFYTLEEFLSIYPYTYDEKALEYIMENQNTILPIAKIYLENITKYKIENVKTEKGKFLNQIKKELLEKKLLKKNILLEQRLKQCDIYLEVEKQKYLEELLSNFGPTWVKEEEKNNTPICYDLENIDEEIAFVGEQIIKLLKQGISTKRIVLANVGDEYRLPLKRIFKMMGIPLELNETTTLNQTPLGKMFLENLLTKGKKEAIEELLKNEKTEEEKELIEQIITIRNKFVGLKKETEFIEYTIRKTKKKETITENGIKEINLKKDKIEEDTYCFILSFNEKIPHTYKDEEYLNDETRKSLNIDTSMDKNEQEKRILLRKIKGIKNVVITYSKNNGKKACYPSPLLEELGVSPEKGTLLYNVSHNYNKYMLGIKLDTFVKYGTITPFLPNLKKTYEIPYRTYNNAYQIIPKEKIKNHLKEGLTLSYTKLDFLNKCAFSYYLTHILRLAPYEETFMIKIGNIFHKVLEQKDEKTFEFEECWRKAKEEYEFSKKEEFFLKLLKEELAFSINRLEELKNFTVLESSLKEQEFIEEIDGEIKVTFKGIIDNLMYTEKNGTLVYSVIDYKTGNPRLDETKMKEGFFLQLPTYMYLLKKDPYFKNAKFGGFYLQPLITHDIEQKKGENILYTKQKALKRIGYSTSNKELLEMVDSSYNDSNLISGLKTKKDGEFYNYSKVLDQKDEETLQNLVEENIEKGINAIINSEFTINPKIFDNKDNISCDYCPFKDICYHEPKDNIYKKSSKLFKKEEEQNGMDERTRISNT